MAANEFLRRHISLEDRNAKLWRYIPIKRFEEMAAGSYLWFSRADKFDDAFEGATNDFTKNIVQYGPDVTPEMVKHFEKVHIWWKQWTFVNCWHLSRRENALMWAAYAKHGVVVQTTYEKLAAHLPENACLSPVLYRDFEREIIPEGTHIRYYVKRHYFRDEREVRAVIVSPPPTPMGTEDLTRSNPELGIRVKVNLNSLLEAVVCRPYASHNEIDERSKFCRGAGLTVPTVESQLSGSPRWV